MRAYVGVDGGTSRCSAAVIDPHGNVRGRGAAGPIYGGDGDDHPDAHQHLRAAISEALAAAGLTTEQVACVYLACSNWYGEAKRADAEAALGPLGLSARTVISPYSDSLSAWAAGGSPDPSVFITLGTFWGGGAWMEGRYWPHILDMGGLDLTSGLWAQGDVIGTSGLIAAIQSQVGGRPTSLFDRFCTYLGAATVEELAAWAAAHETPKERAALARITASAAQAGDEGALAIYRRAAEGVAAAFAAQAHHMGLANREVVCLVSGNTLKAGEVLLGPLRTALAAQLPLAELRVNREDPSVGAAILALRAAEGATD